MKSPELGGFPSIEKKENSIPSITKEEWNKYCTGDINNTETMKWMEEKGIEFDQGMIKVEYEGIIKEMQTSRDDFGTMSYDEDDVIESGY